MNKYFKNTIELFDEYKQMLDRIYEDINYTTTDEEDEFLANFCVYLAHALLKDYGTGGVSRSELLRCAKILQDVIEE